MIIYSRDVPCEVSDWSHSYSFGTDDNYCGYGLVESVWSYDQLWALAGAISNPRWG